MIELSDMTLRLAQATGVSGAEDGARRAARELLEPLGPVREDPVGNLFCQVRPAREGQRCYLLDAHLDEIGMIVTQITEEGFLKVAGVGGLDRRLLLASQVTVHAQGGPLTGVVASIPPHLQEGEQENPKVEDLHIDLGFPAERARELVCPGDRVTFCSRARKLPGGRVVSKALDDRAGCAAVLRAAELLKEEPLSCGLLVSLTTQEETGMAGCKTAGFSAAPTHCITVDVSFAHTPDAPRWQCGEFGKGPMIGMAPILSKRMSQRMVEVAKEAGIPYQTEVMGGATGTNADGIACSGPGVATSLLSIPQRYMHTPVEMVDMADVEQTARLIAAYIKAEEGRV